MINEIEELKEAYKELRDALIQLYVEPIVTLGAWTIERATSLISRLKE